MRQKGVNKGVVLLITLIIINSFLLLLSLTLAHIFLHKEIIGLLKKDLINHSRKISEK